MTEKNLSTDDESFVPDMNDPIVQDAFVQTVDEVVLLEKAAKAACSNPYAAKDILNEANPNLFPFLRNAIDCLINVTRSKLIN